MNIKKRGKFNLNSRAQAAIFIIISLLIVLAGLTYFFYQKQLVEKQVELVPPEIAPVKLFIDNCIKAVSEDGLETIGLTGGYINVPAKISNDPRAYLATFPGFKMPYWWHDGVSASPTEDFIKQQLRDHIKTELKNCLNNFESFEGRFEIAELKPLVADVEFNEEDVTVNINYPLQITSKNGDLKFFLEKFRYIVPIRFKKIYELAKLIMERENKEYFLEKKTIDLMSIDREIPTTDVEATCNTRIWQLSTIMEKLKTLLRVNLPYIRIKGTSYDSNLYVPNPSGRNIYSETYFQQHYVWDIAPDAGKEFNNLKVAVTYDNWPLSIYARPSDNGILRSNSQKGTQLLSFLCLHIWHFTYDINYPVLITIFDQETKKNMQYQFNFPFRVSIDHNQPNRLSKGTTLFETESDLSSEEYCNAAQNEITIFTVNNATSEDIRDVNLTFICGRYYCDMGQSNWLSLGASAGITKRFPYCVYGIIKGTKEGFAESSSFVQTDVDGRAYVLLLNPEKEFQNYRVVKHLLSEPSIEQELAPNEKASIILKGKDTGFEGFAVYPKESNFPLKLPSGKDITFDATIYVVDDEGIVGGYIGEWKLGKNDLTNANEVVFHIIEQGPATDDEKFLFVSGLSSYSKKVPAPELK